MFWIGFAVGAAIGWTICMFVCLPHQKKLWKEEQKKDAEAKGK